MGGGYRLAFWAEWSAVEFRKTADAMRLEGRLLSLTYTGAGAAREKRNRRPVSSTAQRGAPALSEPVESVVEAELESIPAETSVPESGFASTQLARKSLA